MKHLVIVGGGLGGLAAAITLRNAGLEVTVCEKNAHFGGKMRPYQLGKYVFDFGPNTITMPEIFQQVIAQTGENPDDYFQFEKLPVHTRNQFADGSSFSFSSNHEAMKRELANIAPAASEQYDAYVKEVKRIYDISKQHFLSRVFTSATDYASPSLGLATLRVRPFETLHHFHQRYFQDYRIIQAFDRYATYVGSSPYQLPATFSMIAHLELNDGVYYTKGGNVSIAKGFERLARKIGVTLMAENEVTELVVRERQVEAVKLASGEEIDCDAVFVNGDVLGSFPKMVNEQHRPSFSDAIVNTYEPSISAFVSMVGLSKRLPGWQHHNVFFSDDYEQEFIDLFQTKTFSKNPTIYVCNSAVTDETKAFADHLFILVNAPSITRTQTEQYEKYKELIYAKLAEQGFDIRPFIVEEKVVGPVQIEQDYYAYAGALYGPSSNTRKTSFFRPRNKSSDLKNVYFVGGSTHPGGGSPMVTTSGLLVAKHFIEKTL